jgi:hypothetical protein
VLPPYLAFKGEVTRIIFRTLRAANQTMTTNELTEVMMMKARGLACENRKLFRVMTQRVGSMLNHWRRVKGGAEVAAGAGENVALGDRRSAAIVKCQIFAIRSRAPLPKEFQGLARAYPNDRQFSDTRRGSWEVRFVPQNDALDPQVPESVSIAPGAAI